MSEIAILETQQVDGFAYTSDFGVYAKDQADWFTLQLGNTYRVVWDGQEYVCEAYTYDFGNAKTVGIGAETFLKGDSSVPTEPFAIHYLDATGYSAMMAFDTATFHTVGIYLVNNESGDEPGSTDGDVIIIHDRHSNPVEYSGVGRIRVETADGGIREYVNCDVTEATVELDFCYGDMTIDPKSGGLFSKITIPQPENLIPDNIMEGVTIAGVAGIAKSGGASGITPGVYWKHDDTKRLSKYYQAQCSLNGEIYLFSLPFTGTGNDNAVYKLVDGEWVQIIAKFSINSGTPKSARFVEYHGRIHIIGGETVYHYVFDGAIGTKLSDIPGKIKSSPGPCAFVYDDKLLAFSYNTGNIYEWNENSDTWSVYVSLFTTSYNAYIPFVFEGLINLYKDGKLYRVTGNTLMEIATSPVSTFYAMIAHNGCIYGIAYSTANDAFDLYKFDVGTQFRKIGKLPCVAPSSYCNFWIHDGQLRLLCGDNTNLWVDLIMIDVQ